MLERPGRPLDVHVGFGVALALDAGMLPRAPALGLEPSVQLRVDWLRAQLGVGLWRARSGTSERYEGAELAGSAVIGELALGADPLAGTIVLGPRALLELGRLVLETDGVTAPERASTTWLAVGAGMQASLEIAPGLAANLQLGAVFPFTRPRWLLRTESRPIALFTASPAVLRASTGLAYVFP